MTISTRTISTIASAVTNNLHAPASTGGQQETSRPATFVKTNPHSHNNNGTFAAILKNARSLNIRRLKDRAFLANRLAKIAVGTSRTTCYRLKDEAVNALVRHGAACLHSVDGLPYGPTIGLAFINGGRLHIPPSQLDAPARRFLQQQFAAALCGWNCFEAPPNSMGKHLYDLTQGGQQ